MFASLHGFSTRAGSEIPVGGRHCMEFKPGSRFFHQKIRAAGVVVTRNQKNFMNTAPSSFTGDVLGFIECRDCIAPERLEVGWRKAVRLRERNGFIGLIGKQVGIAADQRIRRIPCAHELLRSEHGRRNRPRQA